MAVHPIESAYQACQFVPSEAYRTGGRRKMHNPIRTTPALVQAMIHMGERDMDLIEARRRAKRAVQEPSADRYIDSLDWSGLLDFLDTIAVFLKTDPQTRKEQDMRRFDPKQKEALSTADAVQKAIELATHIASGSNLNKMKKMGAQVTAARDRWEALAGLARFYPRKDIPKEYVDELVGLLEVTDLHSFKQVVSQSLIFHEANRIREG